MSRFNSSECENKSYENYINTEMVFNVPDIKNRNKLSKMPELINTNRKVITNNCFMEDYKMPSNSIYGIHDHTSNMEIPSITIDIKKRGNLISDDETNKHNLNSKDKEIKFDTQSLSDLQINNDRNESIPLVNILKHKNVNAINAPTLGQYPPNKVLLQRLFIADNQDNSNPLITTAYNFNGYHPTEIKTTNSSGSSYINNKQSHALFSSQNSQSMINNDYYQMHAKSQYFYCTQRIDDLVDQETEYDFNLQSGNPKIFSLVTDGNKVNDCNKIQMVNNPKILIPCSVSRKEAVLIQQPECYERDVYQNIINGCCEDGANRLTGATETEIKSGVLRENTIPADYVQPNKCYGVPLFMNDIRNNISYSTQQTPIQLIPIQGPMVVNNINSNFRSMNAYSHYHLTPLSPNLMVQSTEKSKAHGSIFTEQKIKNTLTTDDPDSFISKPEVLEETPLLYTSEPMVSEQSLTQFSSNNELNRISSYPILPCAESITSNIIVGEEANFHTFSQPNLTINELNNTNDLQSDKNTTPIYKIPLNENISNGRVQKIGKFMISPVSPTDEPSLRLTDNPDMLLNYNQTNHTEVSDDIPKLECPPSHSRFKKTRIKETIERWCMNGLNTYDCRVKTIPSKIANLYNSKPEYLSKEMSLNQNCQKCDTHDKEKYCQDKNYHIKEFKFWHNGNHINLCSELENDDKIICQFHARILKLLNQNQNLSLSKYSNNSYDNTENTNLSSQMYQTVLISSPEQENFIINIDSQASHVLYSAPPVSPSIMNTASVSSLPTNLQSPRSATTMVMLKRATPVMLSNATRNTPLLSESISIEKINNITSSNTVIESDNNSLFGQKIRANDNNSLIDLWQSSPLKPDQFAFKLPPTYVAGTVIADNSDIEGQMCAHQQSLYSIGHMSPLYYHPVYQQSLPSISTTMTANKCHDNNTILPNIDEFTQVTDLPIDIVEEISNITNSFKSQITNIFQSEYRKLLDEIKELKKTNEELSCELNEMKNRSDKLENLLIQKNESLIKIQNDDVVDHPTQSTSSQYSRDYQQSDFDCNNLI